MECLSTCPACSGTVEFNLDVNDLLVGPRPSEQSILTLREGEYEVAFRLPVCSDLSLLDVHSSVDFNSRLLLRTCIASVRKAGNEVGGAEIPAELEGAVVKVMGDADPLGNIEVTCMCPHCNHAWQSSLDIAWFLSKEICGLATRLLREVHILAAAYGWRECDILSLPPSRRLAYINLVQ